jgi:hypothetical protein
MQRREFIAGLGSAVVGSLSAAAQQRERDRDVLAFNEALRIQRTMERRQHKRISGGRAA